MKVRPAAEGLRRPAPLQPCIRWLACAKSSSCSVNSTPRKLSCESTGTEILCARSAPSRGNGRETETRNRLRQSRAVWDAMACTTAESAPSSALCDPRMMVARRRYGAQIFEASSKHAAAQTRTDGVNDTSPPTATPGTPGDDGSKQTASNEGDTDRGIEIFQPIGGTDYQNARSIRLELCHRDEQLRNQTAMAHLPEDARDNKRPVAAAVLFVLPFEASLSSDGDRARCAHMRSLVDVRPQPTRASLRWRRSAQYHHRSQQACAMDGRGPSSTACDDESYAARATPVGPPAPYTVRRAGLVEEDDRRLLRCGPSEQAAHRLLALPGPFCARRSA